MKRFLRNVGLSSNSEYFRNRLFKILVADFLVQYIYWLAGLARIFLVQYIYWACRACLHFHLRAFALLKNLSLSFFYSVNSPSSRSIAPYN